MLQAGDQDPDIFFTDRPREAKLGSRNKEYVSIFADEAPRVLCGRSPLECYGDFMHAFRCDANLIASSFVWPISMLSCPCSFSACAVLEGPLKRRMEVGVGMTRGCATCREAFFDDVGSTIEEIVVGTGACGELRYPSYVEANGWRFPGVCTLCHILCCMLVVLQSAGLQGGVV